MEWTPPPPPAGADFGREAKESHSMPQPTMEILGRQIHSMQDAESGVPESDQQLRVLIELHHQRIHSCPWHSAEMLSRTHLYNVCHMLTEYMDVPHG